ncbi:MAG: hypothetical protein WBD40_25580 [Tepidisphaeraceae bacterium]
MIFSWDDENREHIAKHAVTPEEAEEVVRRARPPFPRAIGEGKHMVWGQTSRGRYLQAIIVFKAPEELDHDALTAEQWAEIESTGVRRVVRVIHAMDLTEGMKRSLRKRRR